MSEEDIVDALLSGMTTDQLQAQGESLCDINAAIENWEKRIS